MSAIVDTTVIDTAVFVGTSITRLDPGMSLLDKAVFFNTSSHSDYERYDLDCGQH